MLYMRVISVLKILQIEFSTTRVRMTRNQKKSDLILFSIAKNIGAKLDPFLL